MYKKQYFFAVLAAFFVQAAGFAEPLYSNTWGFTIDLPEEYYLNEDAGDGTSRFSFFSGQGYAFDMVVYQAGTYAGAEALADSVTAQLGGKDSDKGVFRYYGRDAALFTLSFSLKEGSGDNPYTGWGLVIELDPPQTGDAMAGVGKPLLLAMAYGPPPQSGSQRQGRVSPDDFHLSALDSIVPGRIDKLRPGPVTEYAYPQGKRVEKALFGLDLKSWFHEGDAEAAQALVDREFRVLSTFSRSPVWQEAWTRFYRAVYKDSYSRMLEAAFDLERHFALQKPMPAAGSAPARNDVDVALASDALGWVQSFTYERDLLGSDFVNLVTAATEGRGDCDSRSLLWAIIMRNAGVESAIMVSREYSHAMALGMLDASGARYPMDGKNFLVAETTAKVNLGLIGQGVSNTDKWLGIVLE
jgi:hypothetical protein